MLSQNPFSVVKYSSFAIAIAIAHAKYRFSYFCVNTSKATALPPVVDAASATAIVVLGPYWLIHDAAWERGPREKTNKPRTGWEGRLRQKTMSDPLCPFSACLVDNMSVNSLAKHNHDGGLLGKTRRVPRRGLAPMRGYITDRHCLQQQQHTSLLYPQCTASIPGILGQYIGTK